MSDPKEQLKAIVQDLIADRSEQAEVTIHQYLVAKTQELTGLSAKQHNVDLEEQ